MLKKILYLIPLQFFGDGGDGGSPTGDGAASASGESGAAANRAVDSDIPAFVPERAKKNYRKAQQIVAAKSTPEAQSKQATTVTSDNASNTEDASKETAKAEGSTKTDISFDTLINDDKYKSDREKYLNGVFSERFGKYKSIEAEHKAMKDMLSVFGGKYGLDPASKTFMEDLKKQVDADDEFFAEYAAEHGVPQEYARETAQMKARIASLVKEQTERAEAVQREQQVTALKASAARTKAEFPDFDLNKEMSNPDFVKKCAALGGDTTTAYKIVHWDELFNRAQKSAAEKAKAALSQSIASGQSRPSENGLNKNAAPAPAQPDFSGMNSKQLREWFFKNKG